MRILTAESTEQQISVLPRPGKGSARYLREGGSVELAVVLCRGVTLVGVHHCRVLRLVQSGIVFQVVLLCSAGGRLCNPHASVPSSTCANSNLHRISPLSLFISLYNFQGGRGGGEKYRFALVAQQMPSLGQIPGAHSCSCVCLFAKCGV